MFVPEGIHHRDRSIDNLTFDALHEAAHRICFDFLVRTIQQVVVRAIKFDQLVAVPTYVVTGQLALVYSAAWKRCYDSIPVQGTLVSHALLNITGDEDRLDVLVANRMLDLSADVAMLDTYSFSSFLRSRQLPSMGTSN